MTIVAGSDRPGYAIREFAVPVVCELPKPPVPLRAGW